MPPQARPRLHTPRLHLQPVQPTHLPEVHRGLSNPAVTRYLLIHFPSLESAREQMAFYESLWATGGGAWAIGHAGAQMGQPLLGVVILSDPAPAHRRAELGIWLMPEASGQGYAHEACHAVLAHALSPGPMGLHKVVSVVEAPNAPSLALMRRLGFRQEGLLRQHDWRASQPIDLVCFGLLACEWVP